MMLLNYFRKLPPPIVICLLNSLQNLTFCSLKVMFASSSLLSLKDRQSFIF